MYSILTEAAIPEPAALGFQLQEQHNTQCLFLQVTECAVTDFYKLSTFTNLFLK